MELDAILFQKINVTEDAGTLTKLTELKADSVLVKSRSDALPRDKGDAGHLELNYYNYL
jgi:hypothetical protein